MSRLSKTEREEIINQWLEGEENDEYEVKPTKEEGKYRVLKRTSTSNTQDISPKPKKSKLNEEICETNKEILKYLRSLGEENERKKLKREITHTVKKELNKTIPVEDEQSEEEPQTVIIVQNPRYQRRRVDPKTLF
jgi:hypothetical protein